MESLHLNIAQYYYFSGSDTSDFSVGMGIGISFFALVCIATILLVQTRVVTNAPAATTVVTTTRLNNTPETAGFEASKGYTCTGYTCYALPPSYPATSFQATDSSGDPTPGYPDAPPPYRS